MQKHSDMTTHNLDLNSKGLKGNALFMRVLQVFNNNNIIDCFGDRVEISKTELFIDGEKWMWVHNADLKLIGISKI